MLCFWIFFTTFSYSILISTTWSPYSLASYVRGNYEIINPYYNYYYLVDPNEYLSSSQKQNLVQIMGQINDKRYVRVIFIIMNQMEAQYVSNIKRFADEFGDLLYSEKDLEDYMIIIFSIEDKKARISTGRRVRKIYSDKMCADYLKEAVKNLQNENYYEAFTEMLKNIEKKKTFNDGVVGIVVPCILVLIIIIAFILAIKMTISEYKIVKRIQAFLETMKEKKVTKDIFFKNCAICFGPLETINNNKQDGIGDKCCYECVDGKIYTKVVNDHNCNPEKYKENENDDKAIQINNEKKEEIKDKNQEEVLNINLCEDIIKNNQIDYSKGYCSLDVFANHHYKETESNKNNNVAIVESYNNENGKAKGNKTNHNKKENGINTNLTIDTIATLECGHVLHSKCLQIWNKKDTECPICKEQFNELKEDELSQFGERILSMQTVIYPVLSHYYFSMANFTIKKHIRYSSSRSRSGGRGGGGGGASGGW